MAMQHHVDRGVIRLGSERVSIWYQFEVTGVFVEPVVQAYIVADKAPPLVKHL
jgi:hypothetical protein